MIWIMKFILLRLKTDIRFRFIARLHCLKHSTKWFNHLVVNFYYT